VRPTVGVSVPTLSTRVIPKSVLAGYRRQRGRGLHIPAGVLRPGRTVTLRATVRQDLVTAGATITVSASVSVSVVVRPSGVKAAIAGGLRRAVSPDSDIVFDGRDSADLDASARPLSLSWSCRLVARDIETEEGVLGGIENVQSLPSSFDAGSECSQVIGQPALNLSDHAYLPSVEVPLVLRGDSPGRPTRRGPLLLLPSTAIPAGSIAVLSLSVTRNPGETVA